ncbi:MAG: hypothetical protein LZF62_320107 [Nitrospira sp.]|nr:MAG: hypothetical protein LZF62_320107 [Nitrospira sp.]
MPPLWKEFLFELVPWGEYFYKPLHELRAQLEGACMILETP